MTTPTPAPAIAELLDFEARWPVNDGRKTDRIRRTFGLTATRYFQALNVALDTAGALEHDPQTTYRLRARRSAAAARRRALLARPQLP